MNIARQNAVAGTQARLCAHDGVAHAGGGAARWRNGQTAHGHGQARGARLAVKLACAAAVLGEWIQPQAPLRLATGS